VLPIALGLGAAASVGAADFCAGIATRRISPLIVGFWTQGIGGIVIGCLIVLLRPPLAAGQIPWGLGAGLATGIGLALMYRAMAVGALSLVGPITACSVVFPVVYSVARGETLAPLAAAGVVAIISGVVLASLQPAPVVGDPTDTGIAGDRRAAALALAAMVGFGAFYILIDLSPQTGDWGTLWTVGSTRASAFGVQAVLLALGLRRISGPGRTFPLVAVAGVLDQTALVLIGLGARTDAYGIVTALAGLYPVVMVLLGTIVLGERLTRFQASGATLAITGVLLVSV
jgi:drug/metabolite transporter (DMT)-like permease